MYHPVTHRITYTQEQINENNKIIELTSFLEDDNLSITERERLMDMVSKRKEKLVTEIYFKDKRRKEFYNCKDGRVKSYDPQFIATSKDRLIEKLYAYYFENVLEDVYNKWIDFRSKTECVSAKTIEEDIGIWKRFIANSEIARMRIDNIKPKHLMKLFLLWTGNGRITRKDFNNRKSVLNGIFRYAVLNETINYNPITSLSCSELKFKVPLPQKKAYTVNERTALLAYLDTLEPDAYILAIQFAFRSVVRIGEIKSLTWNVADGNIVTIQSQLVEERVLNDDMSLSHPRRILKNPKGNPYYSIRKEYISNDAVRILEKMKELNPHGEYLFMHEGRPLTTDTFNRRLKKYCTETGIPYLSSHKIRFTGASMLYDAGVKPIDIQPILGHSTLAMTQHYICQPVAERDTTQMARILT